MMRHFCCSMLVMLFTNVAIAELSAEKQKVISSIDSKRAVYSAISRQIWKWAELSFVEFKSSELLQDTLKKEGFEVQSEVADMPTAFVASFGRGKPIIGLLAEFDALPGMSQEVCPERKPLVEGAPGHGCGHNLLGVGCTAAAIAVKDWLIENSRRGTIRVYGCPAEERDNGKLYMAQAGLFDNLDAALTWHPGSNNSTDSFQTIAIHNMTFKFHGKSSHAGSSPWNGRSALDAVEALNHMANMMREHISPSARMHYYISSGGQATNVVPDYAEVKYTVRSHNTNELKNIFERIQKAAEGAAMGTGTTVEYTERKGCVTSLLSESLSQLAHKNMMELPRLKFTEEQRDFIRKITRYNDGVESAVSRFRHGRRVTFGSDVSFASRCTPTAWISANTWPGRDISAHSWRAVVANGCFIGEEAMLYAAKVIAATAIDIYKNPSIAEKARQELIKRRGTDEPYRPGGGKPNIDIYKD
ncbi:MAG: amidohydrolase [Planctomycetota bacterium]